MPENYIFASLFKKKSSIIQSNNKQIQIMRKLLFMGVIVSSMLISCSKEEDETTPVSAEFTATITGESPNAQLTLENTSTGASAFTWTFGEGASIFESTDKTPTGISIDKAGEITITLVASNGTEQKEASKTLSITGNSAMISYSDIAFALNAGDETYGRLFSCDDGMIYLDNEVDESNGANIHLAFGSLGNTLYYFESPTVEDYNIPNASETQVINYESTPTITTDDFDTMTDDGLLSGLTIVSNDESFGNNSIPGTVLFEIASGKKGVIKTKEVNSDRILVDIKIQKY